MVYTIQYVHDWLKSVSHERRQYFTDIGKKMHILSENAPVKEKFAVTLASAVAMDSQAITHLLSMLNDQNLVLGLVLNALEKEVRGQGSVAVLQELHNAKKVLDEEVRQGRDEIDAHTAKRLTQLLDLKGHEAMYDTGTKPTGTKNEEKEPSFAEPFRKQMLEELNTIEPIIDDAKREFSEATLRMHEAQRINAPTP